MAAASVQKVLVVIAHLRWPTRTYSSPQPKWGGTGAAATLLNWEQSHSRCVAQLPFRDAADRDHFRL
jgi:hypothetical protein